MPTMDYSKFSPFTPREGAYLSAMPNADSLASGESTISRRVGMTTSASTGTQNLILTYFTATKSETINSITIYSGDVAAAATPSIARIGLYTVAADGSLTLVASTANDTTLFATSYTGYNKALSAPYFKEAGTRYALGLLIVSAVATPNVYACSSFNSVLTFKEPKISAKVTAQANLPSTVANGSIVGYEASVYAELLP